MQPPEVKEGQMLCPRCGGPGYRGAYMEQVCKLCDGRGVVDQEQHASGSQTRQRSDSAKA